MNLGLLISGNLGGVILKNILLENEQTIYFVFTDSKSIEIIAICKDKNIPLFVGNPRNGKAASFLASITSPQHILSVNYLFIVEEDIIKKALHYTINIHGSLLPKYRGRTPHVWAIINNEKTTGITAHLIDKGCDTGDIIEQEQIDILDHYTGSDVLDIFYKRYPLMVKRVLHKLNNNEITLIPQEHDKATFFGKRSAEDGRINWSWQKERIRNWVRAQCKPYPGAYTFLGEAKIIIHKVEYTDLGYSWDIPNGIIIKITDNFLFVKTPNGVLKITDFESMGKIKTGEKFT